MSYPAIAIANEFIAVAKEQGEGITPMKVQKLVYFAHGWHLAITGEPLVDEPVQAWRFGPVIPSVYRQFRDFGRNPVQDFARVVTFSPFDVSSIIPRVSKGDKFVQQLITKIWEIYGRFTAVQLSNLTHQDGTPWHKIWNENLPRDTVIPDETIADYFRQQAQRH